VLVDFTHRRHLGGKRDGGIRLGVEPVLHPMWLSIGLMLNNVRHCGCCWVQPSFVCGLPPRPHEASNG
jgi:hypothetical protein